jgi:hypothetical protein
MNSVNGDQYQAWMSHLQSLPMVGLITTGRTGSDFLQSLLDSHAQVATFNGHFLIYTEFFSQSICLQWENPITEDVVDEFIGRYIYKLVSKYDIQEGKDRLGETHDQSFRLSTQEFRQHVIDLMGGRTFSTRDFLLAVYGAYGLCLKHNLQAKRVIFHHPHLVEELPGFLRDFPKAALIFTTRDPRANYVSHVEHFRSYYKVNDNEQHIYQCLRMMLEDSLPGKRYGVRYTATRLEDLPRESTLVELSRWLGIDFDEILLRSTWAGLDWHGDRLSKKVFQSKGWSEKRTENNWSARLGKMDQYIFNFIMNSRLRHYRYEWKPISWLDALAVFLLIPLPMKYERYYFSWSYISSVLSEKRHSVHIQFLLAPLFYFRRVALCYRFYFSELRGERFDGHWIGNQELQA